MSKKKDGKPTDNLVDISAKVKKRVAEESELLGDEKKKKSSAGGPDDPRFIRQCLEHNERGDGILFASLHKGKFVYVKSRDEKAKAWFIWSGHHWEIDKADFHHSAVEDVALLYQREADNIKPETADARAELDDANDNVKHYNKLAKDLAKNGSVEQIATCDTEGKQAAEAAGKAKAKLKKLTKTKKELLDRVDRLRSLRGAKNCIEYSHKIGREGLWIFGDEVDQKPMLLPCENGVIDLETGKLIKGNPDDYMVRAIPVEFKGIDEPAPNWEKFISEIHQEDPELIEFILRFFGYCLTGKDPEQVYAFFIGDGANGKGLMFEILREILGDLSWSINPEMLLDNKTQKSPDGPSPATMSLQGRRLVVASETDEGRKISGANLKRYTGGDTLTGRNLFDKYDTNFKPSHKLAIITNSEPRGLASDFAMMRRLLYIEYPLSYVDDVEYWQKLEPHKAHLFRKKDGNLKEKLLAEKSGILACLVRYCLKWQTPDDGGLKVPTSIRAAVEAVRDREDYVGQFIDKVCNPTRPTECITFTSLYNRFKQWYTDEHGSGEGKDKYLIKKRKFGEQLRKKGYLLPDATKTSGKQHVSGLTFESVAYDDQYFWHEAPEGGPGE